jgi:chromosome segregation ATPase
MMMTKRTNDDAEAQEQLADALAQIESLQTAAADAAARAETARGQLDEAAGARRVAEDEAERLRADLADTQTRVREAAARYRASRLSAHPEVPGEMVPETETIEEVDQAIDAALKVVGMVRERVEEEQRERRAHGAVPAGSPPRKTPDLSALPASEKIRLGLQQRG